MRKSITVFSLFWTLLFLTGPVQAQGTFVIGVAPHTSARIILDMYQPLRLYLEKSLDRTVDIITAPDFTEFARRGINQAYDLAVTTGHQAWLLHADAKYIPLLTYKTDFRAVVIVARKSQIDEPKDLQGKRVLGLSPSSLVTLWGQHWLAENHLNRASITYVSASDSIARQILSDQAAAGFVSSANFDKLPTDFQSQLRVLAQGPPMAGRVYLLNSRQAAQQKQIDAALWAFADTPEGHRYFEANSLGGYRKLRTDELRALSSYAESVRAALQGGSK